MSFRIEINGVPIQRFTNPGTLRSGYRGPLPASREAGSASFEILHTTVAEKAMADGIVKGQPVIIYRDDVKCYTGVVSEVPKREKYRTQIETKESAASFNDLEVGMPTVGGMLNPILYLYKQETRTDAQGVNDGESVQEVLEVILKSRYDSLDAAVQLQYEKVNLLDSYGYGDGAHPTDYRKYRSYQFYEEPILSVVNKAVGLSSSQEGPEITAVDIRLGGRREQMSRGIVDENGKRIDLGYPFESWGMMTRTEGSATMTYLWVNRPENSQVEIFQLVHHGLAKKLGFFNYTNNDFLVTGSFPIRYLNPYHGGSYGPFAVMQSQANLLSWYFIAIEYFEGVYQQRAVVYELDLSLPKNHQSEDALTMRKVYLPEQGGVSEYSVPQPYVINLGAQGQYGFTSSFNVLRETSSARTGGIYSFIGSNVHWTGDLYLSELAYDYENASLKDVLSDICQATGSEWYIDVDGVLRIERMDRASRTIKDSADVILSDSTLELAIPDDEVQVDFNGIEVTELYAFLIAKEQKLLVENFQPRRRVISYPQSPKKMSLGAMLLLNGRAMGRVCAVEYPRSEVVTVELEHADMESEREL